ncbi:family 2 glycosyltransferase [Dendrothele bispora CBS 962.96]|uniref:Family 2 glycosyltransferase n=1 Tax=Dendrothele bispora (strain CBS 962.96) TaxID=1314807 RepID=A0A4V4HEY4_DENBC|nr:family 2 glycosyltransferase [Dendrothele bispora CBS 962.96]
MLLSYLLQFFALFVVRYSRLFINLFARARYQPAPRPKHPNYGSNNVICYIPSVNCSGINFQKTVQSAILTGCRTVYISTIQSATENAHAVCDSFRTRVCILADEERPNKRMQVSGVEEEERIKLILCLDDHVWMEDPAEFLADTIAPFENPVIGGVAVGKKVECLRTASGVPCHLLNLLGCFYLLRHNWELCASNTLDGGVFVISGRAACFRAEILTDHEFMTAFLSEYFAQPFFGQQIGPLHADDDNFVTRWLIGKGWKIKFQHTRYACIITSLGVDGPHKWLQQCIRWSRTTIRSNLTSLSNMKVWFTYPWTTVTVYIPALCNYALLIDPCLLWLSWQAAVDIGASPCFALLVLVAWMLVTKVIKIYPHLHAYPEDIWLLPVQFGFGYLHSLIKLYSTLTFWKLGWGSRPDQNTDINGITLHG